MRCHETFLWCCLSALRTTTWDGRQYVPYKYEVQYEVRYGVVKSGSPSGVAAFATATSPEIRMSFLVLSPVAQRGGG